MRARGPYVDTRAITLFTVAARATHILYISKSIDTKKKLKKEDVIKVIELLFSIKSERLEPLKGTLLGTFVVKKKKSVTELSGLN